MAYTKPGSPFLFDETTNDIVGFKDRDGGDSPLSPVSGGGITPTGSDDAALLSEYVHDMAASRLPAILGAGDFIVGTPMEWRSVQVREKWGSQGIGLRVFGQGPANTRLKWSAALSDAANMLTINAPSSAGIGQRNYLTEIGDMSIIRAPGGSDIAAGSVDGFGIYGGPAALGDVFHTPKFKNIYIDGLAYPITLSDCTLPEFDTVWFDEFLVGLRLGYNCDLVKIRHSMFGSEQFGTSYRNSAIGIQSGFNDGFHSTGNGTAIDVEQTWFMKIGCGLEIAAADSFNFDNTYFEGCRQYWRVTAAVQTMVAMNQCTFSKPNENDDVSYPKMVMGSAGQSRVKIAYCDGGTTAPVAPWLANTGNNPTIEWVQNRVPSGSLGHYRWAAVGNERSLTFSSAGAGAGRVAVTMGGTYGLTKTSGEDRVTVTATTGTITCDHWAADLFETPALTGGITINITGGAVPAVRGTRLKFRIQASATSPETRTVTWAANVIFSTPFVQPTASDASKWTFVEAERTSSNWMVVSPANQWVL